MKYKSSILIAVIFLITFAAILFSQEKNFKWQQLSGKWEVSKDEKGPFLIEKEGKCYNWDYNEIINFNSIRVINPVDDYSSIKFTIEVIDPVISPVDLMLFFSVKDYSSFYAFKFIIDNSKDNELQFISSKITDKSLDKSVKKNFTITKLQSKKYNLEFDKKYNIEIKVNKNKAGLFIDDKKEMEAGAEENLNSGFAGFSVRNAKLRIRDVKIYSGLKLVFEDDFVADLIKRLTVRAKRVK